MSVSSSDSMNALPIGPKIEEPIVYSRTLKGAEISGKINYSIQVTQEGALEINFNVQEKDAKKAHVIKIETDVAKADPEAILKQFDSEIKKEVGRVRDFLEGSNDDFAIIQLPRRGQLVLHKRKKAGTPPLQESAPTPVKPLFRRPSLKKQVHPPVQPKESTKAPVEGPVVKKRRIAEMTVEEKRDFTEKLKQATIEVQNKLHELAEDKKTSAVEKSKNFHEFLIEKRKELDEYFQKSGRDIEVLNKLLPESILGLDNPKLAGIINYLEQVFIGKLIRFAGEKLDEDFRNVLSGISTCYNKCIEEGVQKNFQSDFFMLKAYRNYLECQTQPGIVKAGVTQQVIKEAGRKVGEIYKQTAMISALVAVFEDMIAQLSQTDKAKLGELQKKMMAVSLILVDFQQRIEGLVKKESQAGLHKLYRELIEAQESGDKEKQQSATTNIQNILGDDNVFIYKEAINILPVYERLQTSYIEFMRDVSQFSNAFLKGIQDIKKLNEKHEYLFQKISKKTLNAIGFTRPSKTFDGLLLYLTQQANQAGGNYDLFVRDFLTLYSENTPKRNEILESFIQYKLSGRLQQ
jgi:hypothetical protein